MDVWERERDSITDCDRMCGLFVNLPNSDRSLNILGIYMPSAEQPQEVYSSYLDSVEHAISQLTSQGPLLIMGDLNAHLGDRIKPTPEGFCGTT